MKKVIFLLLIHSSFFSQSSLIDSYNSELVKNYKNITNFSDISKISVKFNSSINSNVAYLPCVVNGVLDYFIFDSGCDVGLYLNKKIFLEMIENKKIFYEDYVGDGESITADGKSNISKIIIIDEVIIGNYENSFKLKNVLASVSNSDDSFLLLGQDIIKRFSSVTIDNKNEKITFIKWEENI